MNPRPDHILTPFQRRLLCALAREPDGLTAGEAYAAAGNPVGPKARHNALKALVGFGFIAAVHLRDIGPVYFIPD